MSKKENALSLREIQLAEYDILCKVVSFLDDNGLHYILCGGTMLGAVRHNGFIPWDDDIDILVPRDDYEAFKKLVREKNCESDDLHFCLPGDKGFPYPFIKAINPKLEVVDDRFSKKVKLNLWVDIFPLDHFSDDAHEHRFMANCLVSYQHVIYAGIMTDQYWKDRGYYGNVANLIKLYGAKLIHCLMGGKEKLGLRVDRIARKMNERYRNSNHVGDGAWPSGMKDYFPLEAVAPVMKHRFEDSEFNIPADYNMYLTLFYGDYMIIPPVDKRQNHHIEVYRAQEMDSNL